MKVLSISIAIGIICFAQECLAFHPVNMLSHSNKNLKMSFNDLNIANRKFSGMSCFRASIASVVMLSTFSLPVNAVMIDSITTSEIVEQRQSTEEDRVKRKLELQRKSSGETEQVTSNDEEGYMGSLQREKVKQQAMKKSKAQRAKDMCETLGRGC
eukprot:gene13770-29285_t